MTSCQVSDLEKADECEVKPVCPIRSPLQRIRMGIWNLLQNTTVRSLADSSLESLFSPLPVD